MNDRWTYTFSAAKGPKGDLCIIGRSYFDRVVASLRLAEGEVCDLTLSEHVETRTNAQNRMGWGTVYDQILLGILTKTGLERYSSADSKARAAAKQALHEALCMEYGGVDIEPLTGRAVRKFHSSKASKQEYSDYIKFVARHAAQEWGVVVVLPDEAA